MRKLLPYYLGLELASCAATIGFYMTVVITLLAWRRCALNSDANLNTKSDPQLYHNPKLRGDYRIRLNKGAKKDVCRWNLANWCWPAGRKHMKSMPWWRDKPAAVRLTINFRRRGCHRNRKRSHFFYHHRIAVILIGVYSYSTSLGRWIVFFSAALHLIRP